MKTSFILLFISIVIVFFSGCQIGYPFQGPAYSSTLRRLDLDVEQKIIVAITQADIKATSWNDWWKFHQYIRPISEALSTQEGILAYGLQKNLLSGQVKTFTVWKTKRDLKNFIHGHLHQTAIESGSSASMNFKYISKEVKVKDLEISWEYHTKLLNANNKGYKAPNK